jgi:hypothetical protein
MSLLPRAASEHGPLQHDPFNWLSFAQQLAEEIRRSNLEATHQGSNECNAPTI